MRSVFSLFIFSFIIMSSTSFASDFFLNDQAYIEKKYFGINHANRIEEKVYIQSDSIYALPNQIYVKIEKDLIKVKDLSCDEDGIFFSIQDIQTGK